MPNFLVQASRHTRCLYIRPGLRKCRRTRQGTGARDVLGAAALGAGTRGHSLHPARQLGVIARPRKNGYARSRQLCVRRKRVCRSLLSRMRRPHITSSYCFRHLKVRLWPKMAFERDAPKPARPSTSRNIAISKIRNFCNHSNLGLLLYT